MWQEQDLATLGRIARGESEALEELYDRHARSIYSLAFRILRDPADAEEVVQDVFSQAWRQAARYDAARGAVVAWLLTLTRSRAIDRLRARGVGTSGASTDRAIDRIPEASAGIEASLLSAELVERVRMALDALPLMQRVALELAYYEGLTHVEIAERLEQPLGTIKTRIRAALMKLREALAEKTGTTGTV
jgi:RNA polymerase sigma-70 factor (ECF subfamily)